MKILNKLGYKTYFLIFGWLCFGELGILLNSSSDVFIYYRVLQSFYPPSAILYVLALLRAIVNIICLIPLYGFAFSKPIPWIKPLKILLFVRVLLDLVGHNYEWLSVKSLFYIKPFLPVCALAVWVGINFVSYKAHCSILFQTNRTAARNKRA